MIEFMKIVSLAHSCEAESFIDKDGKKNKFYNGPSPDEVALVEWASAMEFDCIESTEEKVIMAMNEGDVMIDKEYTKLYSIDFTSDRKRMSVLIRDPKDGKIKLLIKGADSVIKARLDLRSYPPELAK